MRGKRQKRESQMREWGVRSLNGWIKNLQERERERERERASEGESKERERRRWSDEIQKWQKMQKYKKKIDIYVTVIFGEKLSCARGSTFYPEGSTVLATFRDPLVDRRDESLANDPDSSISYDRSSSLSPLPRQPDRAWNAHVGIVVREKSALEYRASSGWLCNEYRYLRRIN